MEIRIAVRSGGEYKGSKVVQTPCFIGRSKDAGLTISHPSVSRKHCELFEEAGRLFLRDNSSLNGTLLKGEFVEGPVAVKPGDEFVIGELQLRIEPASNADADTESQVPAVAEPISEMGTAIRPATKAENDDDDDELQLAPE